MHSFSIFKIWLLNSNVLHKTKILKFVKAKSNFQHVLHVLLRRIGIIHFSELKVFSYGNAYFFRSNRVTCVYVYFFRVYNCFIDYTLLLCKTFSMNNPQKDARISFLLLFNQHMYLYLALRTWWTQHFIYKSFKIMS